MTTRDPLAAVLDRFDVPPMTTGLTDRIVAAATAAAPVDSRPAPRRDRRGVWRRGRQAIVGLAAFGMLSAAAVASGLLGSAGIEVPVLTAMLAPRPVHVHKSKTLVAARSAHKAHVTAPVPPVAVPDPVTAPPPVAFAARQELRAERRERIMSFAQQHPRVAAVIARRVGQQLRHREAVRRETLGFPPADPASPGFRPLTLDERFALRQERRRDFRRAEAIIDRRIARRQMWRAEREGSPSSANVPPPTTNDPALNTNTAPAQ